MSKFRMIAKAALCGILVPLLAVAIASPGYAWTWNQASTVYNGPEFCVQGDAGIDHFRPDAFSGNLAYANTFARSAGCGAGLGNQAARVRLDVHKWTGLTWVLCRSTDWTFGTTGVNQWGPTGPGQVYDYGGSASCGPGYYGTMAYSEISDGSTWRGGHIWSGAEMVP
jgi:hypothetical protein